MLDPAPTPLSLMRIGPRRRITAADVARRAGVSQPTVSLVLSRNPKARVADDTRARVLKAAEELGYRPNRLAQGLVSRRSYAVGIIVPDFSNPVYAEMISGAERVAAQQGYAVLLCEARQTDPVRHLDALRDRQTDGVIMAGVAAATLPAEAIEHLNVVLINQSSDQFPTVSADSVRAGELAAEHLLSLGHERFAYIGPANSIAAFRLRERGFTRRLREAGFTIPSERLRRTGASVGEGHAAMRALLGLAERPTAVFCANDLIALGAHKACAAARLLLPHDLSLLGCDDIEMATLVTPELSTIHTPQRELGARAVRLLVRQLEGKGRTPEARVLPVSLVRRGTTGPAPFTGGGHA